MPVRWWVSALLLAGVGCARSHGSVALMAPFSDDTVIGKLTVSWSDSGVERAAGATTEHRVTFRVDAVNDLSDGLYLRLRALRLLAHGAVIDTGADVECRLASGPTPRLLAGELWIPASQARAIGGFQVDRLAVPLSQRGRAFYREFLLQQHPGTEAAIDAELAAYASAPPCAAGPPAGAPTP